MNINSDILSNKHELVSNRTERFSSPHSADTSDINVGTIERFGCALAGGALAVYGLRRRSPVGLLLTVAGAALLHRGTTGHCNTYQLLGFSTAEQQTRETDVARDVHVEKSIVINKSPEELYHFWRDFENLPRFMDHLESVNSVGFNRWHWVAKAPAGIRPEWDAEIYNEKPNELIAWRSLDGTVTNAGSVHFEPVPEGHGTRVKVVLNYNAPGGKISALVAKVFGQEPGQMIEGDLRRLKEILERGDPATVGSLLAVGTAAEMTKDEASTNESRSGNAMPESHPAEGRAATAPR